MNTLRRVLFSWLVVLLALLVPAAGSAQSLTTAQIATETIAAVPSCARYQVVGACFFLRCTLFSCSVRTSIRVRHFTPDLVVSLYHDPLTHPWEWGRVLARATTGVGASMSRSPTIDSAGTRYKAKRTASNVMFRDADAIGNPVNILSMIFSGATPSTDSPSSVPAPTPVELMRFFGQGYQQILDQWQSIPDSFASGQGGNARAMMSTADMQGIMGAASGQLSSVTGALDSLGGVLNLGGSSGGSSGGEGSGAGGGGGGGSGGQQGGNGGGSGSGSGGNSGSTSDSGSFFCPAGTTPFGLYYQSQLDAMSWRGVWQLEQLYPATWLPGLREIGSGLGQSWGGVFPRGGALVQQNPVKGSAVLAQRVGDIVGQGAQPHIYAPISLTPGGYVWFGFQGIRENDPNHTIWQRLYPNPERTCSIFGINDSTSVSSYGDGQNAPDRGVVFNLWRRQECCQRLTEIFLGSVAFQ